MGILLVHAATTLVLAGLIWTIQVVHYPLMAQVGEGTFTRYHQEHARRITWLVGPLMLAELTVAVAIFLWPPGQVAAVLATTGLVLLAGIWLATAALAVPAHARLARGPDADAHRRLVRTNWVRTLAWSARGAVALGMLAQHAA